MMIFLHRLFRRRRQLSDATAKAIECIEAEKRAQPRRQRRADAAFAAGGGYQPQADGRPIGPPPSGHGSGGRGVRPSTPPPSPISGPSAPPYWTAHNPTAQEPSLLCGMTTTRREGTQPYWTAPCPCCGKALAIVSRGDEIMLAPAPAEDQLSAGFGKI